MTPMRVAYVHDWLVTYRGGEKVLAALLELFPSAPVYTLFYDPSSMPLAINQRQVRNPWITIPLRPLRKAMLPLLPSLIESLDLSSYDLIISTSSCVAKGLKKRLDARHICYLHSPMRYIWDQQKEYLQGVSHIPGASYLIRRLTPRLRTWDISTSTKDRVDHFVANSSFVQERAKKYYNRDASVLHPPIELERFSVASSLQKRQGYLLAAGALVSYKRFDLAIEAAAILKKPLIIAGSGPMEASLRRQAEALVNADVRFEIQPSDERMVCLLQNADLLLFPGVEDFGMTAIEAMACGTPVVAFAEGGARDFIIPNCNGIFFHEPHAESLVETISGYHPDNFSADEIRATANRYNRNEFLIKFKEKMSLVLNGKAS